MRFAIINPRSQTVIPYDVPDLNTALRLAELKPGEVDHGTVWRTGLGIVVAEYGLFEPPERQLYFSIDRRLYAGMAVLYAFDKHGRSIDYDYGGRWFGTWHADAQAVEAAIAAGAIDRPVMANNGRVFWQWPEPRPNAEAVASMADADIIILDGDSPPKQ